MNSNQFKGLYPGCEIESDDKTYRVEQTDSMGRIKMVHMVFYVDVWKYQDEKFDTEDEAYDYICQLIRETKDELEVLRDVFPDISDDEWKEETEKEIEEKEKLLDNLEDADIETETSGKAFWMHYKDIND